MDKRDVDTLEVQPPEGEDEFGGFPGETEAQDSELFPFQVDAITRGKALGHSTTFIAPMGSGKTRITLEVVRETPRRVPNAPLVILIVCSGTAMPKWAEEAVKWGLCGRDDVAYVTGHSNWRHALWRKFQRLRDTFEPGSISFVICNAQVFALDREVIFPLKGTNFTQRLGNLWFDAVIFDEYHKYMLRRQSQTWKHVQSLALYCDRIYTVSGTPLSKHPGSMWNCFYLAKPRIFNSYWSFLHRYCHVVDAGFGKEVVGVKNSAALQGLIKDNLVVIPEKDVSEQLPAGVRSIIPVEMDPEQTAMLAEMEALQLIITDQRIVTARAGGEALVRARQVLCCPKILDPKQGMGAGFDAIMDDIGDTFVDRPVHAVIFVPYRDACDWIKEFHKEHTGWDCFVLRGGAKPDEITAIRNAFAQCYYKSWPSILVCTIDFAESFDLETCAHAYFLGYVTTTKQLMQAEGRIRRANSIHPHSYWKYIKYVGTHDEQYFSRLGQEKAMITRIIKQHDT